MPKMTKYVETASVSSVILLMIATIVCLYLELYTGAIFIFVITLVIGLVIAYMNRITDTTFVHPSEITIVSVPVASGQ